MAKNSIPGLKTSGGILSKFIGLAVLAALVLIVVKYPTTAAGWALSIGQGIGEGIEGIVTFLRTVFGG